MTITTMSGWKTWVGVIGFVCIKLASEFLGVDMGVAEESAATLVNSMEAVFAGLAVIGIGHKVEKAGLTGK